MEQRAGAIEADTAHVSHEPHDDDLLGCRLSPAISAGASCSSPPLAATPARTIRPYHAAGTRDGRRNALSDGVGMIQARLSACDAQPDR